MNKGFSLIELLIVVVIISGLFLIIYPKVNDIIEDSRVKSDLVSVKKVIESAKLDYTENYLNQDASYEVNNGLSINGRSIKLNNSFDGSGFVFIDTNGRSTYYIHKNNICFYKNNNENYKETLSFEECRNLYEMD